MTVAKMLEERKARKFLKRQHYCLKHMVKMENVWDFAYLAVPQRWVCNLCSAEQTLEREKSIKNAIRVLSQ